MTIKDKAADALERVVKQAVGEDGRAQAYLCRLQLPRHFSSDQHQANGIYRKIISDFGKSVMRRTGNTPRYISIRTDNVDQPEYALCLFTRHGAAFDNPEEYAEKAMEIANSKCGREGWGCGKLDLLELFRDAPKFRIAHDPIQVTSENRASVMRQLQEHLQGQSEAANHQRTLFVSKCP